MKNKLKKITDDTINELLSNDIILPSIYFKCFDKHAKLIDVDIKDESFENEVSDLLQKEYDSINNYVKEATKTISQAASLTNNAKIAIENKDDLALETCYKEINSLQKELEKISNEIYVDYLTKAYNKKWLYNKFLGEHSSFQKEENLVFIEIKDYEYISNTYNTLIADNLLVFIIEKIRNKLNEEGFKNSICRYLNNKFLISLNSYDNNSIETLMENLRSLIIEKTLKSNSGIIINPSFDYRIIKVRKGQSFQQIINNI